MSDGTGISAGVTGSIASVVINMACFVLLCSAYGAFVPVLRGVLIPCGLVTVGYSSDVTAGVTGGITSVIVSMTCRVLLCAANGAFVPVLASVL